MINLSPNITIVLKVAQELWTCQTTHYAHLRVFGCEAYVHIPKQLRKKLESRGKQTKKEILLDYKCKKSIFCGYGHDGQFGYH